MKKTIAVAEILTESCCFSPVPMNRRDFEAECLLYGPEVIPYSRSEGFEMTGFLRAVDEIGPDAFHIVPIIKARGMPPGGPVEADLYAHFKQTLIDGLKSMAAVHGVYLAMHGSMGAVGVVDPEGDLLRAVREAVGPDVPIGVSFDIHANVTRAIAENATFIVGYRTNPHRDFVRTGHRAGEILLRAVRGEIRPTMAFNKMRLLKGGGMGIDLLAPMRSIFSRMKRMDKMDGVLSVSNFMVHIWNDDPEIGWSTIAVTDGRPDLARKLADEIADLNWSVRAVSHGSGFTPSEAIARARRMWIRRKLGHVIFSDLSDCVGAGAPGENTWILKALLEEAPDLTSYIAVRDEAAAGRAFERDLGETVSLTVGGRLDKVYNRPLSYSGKLVFKKDGRHGKTVILKHEGIHLIVAELPDAAWFPGSFTDLGLNLWRADIVVVKSMYHFRWYFLRSNRKTFYVITPGITNVDVAQLEYKTIPRPIYPLDDIPSWRPEDNGG